METYQAPTGALITAQRELQLAETFHRRAMELRAAGYVQSAIKNLARAAEHRAASRRLAAEERWTLTDAGRAILEVCERRGCDEPLDDKGNCHCCDYAVGACPHA